MPHKDMHLGDILHAIPEAYERYTKTNASREWILVDRDTDFQNNPRIGLLSVDEFFRPYSIEEIRANIHAGIQVEAIFYVESKYFYPVGSIFPIKSNLQAKHFLKAEEEA